jgi:dihydrofolate reductase
METYMGLVTPAHSMSLDGFIADTEFRGNRLQAWLRAGTTPSRLKPAFRMAPESARFFDEGVARCEAVISGRRTYDVSNVWGGNGPVGPLPLFVVTHTPPSMAPTEWCASAIRRSAVSVLVDTSVHVSLT